MAIAYLCTSAVVAAQPAARASRRPSPLAAPSPVRAARVLASRRAAHQHSVRGVVAVRAAYQEQSTEALRQWPNPAFVQETLEAFPEAGVADVEQALALWKEGGYVWLDIRSSRLRDSLGHVAGSVHIPYEFDKKRFENGKMVIDSVFNEGWLDELQKKYPKKDTKFIVVDMDGRTHCEDCLSYMFENGYENVVGLRGGFKAWFKTFDFKMRRRVFGEYQENFSSYDRLGSGDSCGIHSSGAGFENQDKASGDFWNSW